MVKAPVAGQVKTRLGRDIGMVSAAWWFRHQVACLLRQIDDPRWQTLLAIAPDTSLGAGHWPAHLPRVPQGAGDLGARMARLLRLPHPGPVCLVGGDIPTLGPEHIARAFTALGAAEFVFGPARDGGFWLAGLRHPAQAPAGLFRDVRWSTRHALADSLATLRGRRYALTDRLSDVDRAADL
jgi:glycosyltransferase A (GT-A) superfamily protein (DUF2064 family)